MTTISDPIGSLTKLPNPGTLSYPSSGTITTGPALVLNFTDSGVLDGRITFTRASAATYFDSTGTLQTVGSGVARANQYADHDPSTLSNLGFLIEEQRTNYITNNSGTGVVTGSPGTAPTGWFPTTTTGVFTRTIVGTGTENGIPYVDIRYQASGAGTASIQYLGGAVQAASVSQVWTASNFIKLVGGSLANVTVNTSLIEDDSGGSFLAGGDSASFAPTSAALATQRRSYTRTNTHASTAYIYSRTAVVFSDAGDVTLRIGGTQLELGAFATSPILTTSAAATRLADSAVMTGTAFSSWWNASQGSFVVEADTYDPTSASAARVIFAAGNGTAAERILFDFFNSTARLVVTDGSSTQAVITKSASSANTFYKAAGAYQLNNFAFTAGGAAVGTDTSGTLPTVDRLNIGSSEIGASFLNGHIQSLNYYATRLPNATLQALTA